MEKECYLKAVKTDQLGSWDEGNPGDVDQTGRFLTRLEAAGPSTACIGASRCFQGLIQ